MTKVTDQISNSAIIDLAKQQFDVAQKSKMPTNIVHLTSKGLVYPETHPLRKGHVNMRYMSAYDEDIITNESYVSEGIAFNMLLAELIIDDIDINDIADCDKDGLIINARILGYGSEYPVTITDPKTGKSIERVIDLASLPARELAITPDSLGEFSYTLTDAPTTIKFKFKNGHSKESKDKPLSTFLYSVITEVNGDRTAAAIDKFIKYEFRPSQSKAFRKHYYEIVPRIKTELQFEGETGDTFTSTFQLGTDLFWF